MSVAPDLIPDSRIAQNRIFCKRQPILGGASNSGVFLALIIFYSPELYKIAVLSCSAVGKRAR